MLSKVRGGEEGRRNEGGRRECGRRGGVQRRLGADIEQGKGRREKGGRKETRVGRRIKREEGEERTSIPMCRARYEENTGEEGGSRMGGEVAEVEATEGKVAEP
jgi:hypothetical protein